MRVQGTDSGLTDGCMTDYRSVPRAWHVPFMSPIRCNAATLRRIGDNDPGRGESVAEPVVRVTLAADTSAWNAGIRDAHIAATAFRLRWNTLRLMARYRVAPPSAECPHHTDGSLSGAGPGWTCPYRCGAFIAEAELRAMWGDR